MRVAALIAILAFAAIADASRVHVGGLRSILSDDYSKYDDDDHKPHDDDHKPHDDDHKEPKYCEDWKEHSDCPKHHECVELDEEICKHVPHCTKNAYGKETCTYHKVCWEYHCVEKPKYCKDWKEHSDCPEYYECVALDKKFCKSEPHCTKNAYGKDTCDYKEVCWDYHCVEKPRYCDPWAKYDDCEKKYGYDWECKKFDKPECTYKDKCTPVKTDHCKAYDYEDKCHYEKGGCKTYAKKKVCKYRDVCIKYKQVEKCDHEKVCKEYKEIKTCVDKCAGYDRYGNCNRYGKDCTTKKGDCKAYEYKKKDCHYEDTDDCTQYKKVEHDCHYVQTHCTEYKKEKKCIKVKKGCKEYEYKDKCEKVEDVCWKGKCVKKPPPPPSPKHHSSKHSEKHSEHRGGYNGNGYAG